MFRNVLIGFLFLLKCVTRWEVLSSGSKSNGHLRGNGVILLILNIFYLITKNFETKEVDVMCFVCTSLNFTNSQTHLKIIWRYKAGYTFKLPIFYVYIPYQRATHVCKVRKMVIFCKRMAGWFVYKI